MNGTQSFTIDGDSCPLEYDGRKSFVRTSKPTQEDYDNLPFHELTCSYLCEPEHDVKLEHSQRRMSNKKLRKICRNLKKISMSTSLLISE